MIFYFITPMTFDLGLKYNTIIDLQILALETLLINPIKLHIFRLKIDFRLRFEWN